MGFLSGIGAALGAINPVAGAATFLAGGGLDMISANQQNQAAIGRQNAAQNFSASQTEAQMRFQERMAGTIHQREVEDLRAAGLNPLLSANAGAPAPGGGAASGTAAPVVPEISAGVASAMSSLRLLQDLKESNTRVLKNIQDTSKSQSETYLADLKSSVADQTSALMAKQNKMLKPEADIAESHPYLYGWSKVASDRGVGASSALDSLRILRSLDLLP